MSFGPALLALLARQDGLLTVEQAGWFGLAARSLRERIAAGGGSRVAPGVFLAGGHPWTARARVRAAGLWIGERGAVSGPAAAWWHGMLDRAPERVQVTVPRRSGARQHRDVTIRKRDLGPADVSGRDGLWLTAPPLTVLETAAALPDGSAFLDRALQRHVRFDTVLRAHSRNLGARGGARGTALLIAAADRGDSAAERLLITILRRAGIDGWRVGHRFGPWTIDLAFPALMLAIELDGWAWHTDVERFRADRRKGNDLIAAGWKLLRYTWHDLVNRPEQVLAEIRAALIGQPRR